MFGNLWDWVLDVFTNDLPVVPGTPTAPINGDSGLPQFGLPNTDKKKDKTNWTWEDVVDAILHPKVTVATENNVSFSKPVLVAVAAFFVWLFFFKK